MTLTARPTVRPHHVAPVIPYLAVALGMYLLHSGWAAMLLYHLGVLAVLTCTRRWDATRTLFAGHHRVWLPGAAALCLGGGMLVYLVWPFAGLTGQPAAALLHFQLPPTTALLWFLGYFTLVNPLVEELLWRSYLGSPSPRPIARDFLFAGYHVPVLVAFVHWYWLPLVLLTLAGAAWAWRQLGRRTGGFLIPFVSHVAADAGIAVAILALIRRHA